MIAVFTTLAANGMRDGVHAPPAHKVDILMLPSKATPEGVEMVLSK
jgi:hypothetical protein